MVFLEYRLVPNFAIRKNCFYPHFVKKLTIWHSNTSPDGKRYTEIRPLEQIEKRCKQRKTRNIGFSFGKSSHSTRSLTTPILNLLQKARSPGYE
jgi:hypothetical protein